MANKILFYQWNAFMQDGIEAAMKRNGLEYDTFFYINDNWDYNENFKTLLCDKIENGKYATVFSINYCPIISDVCEEKGIHYISWVYDAPLHVKRIDTIKNKCNDIYFFDRIQYNTYKKTGVNGVHHLTLASDSYFFSEQWIRKVIEERKAGKRLGGITETHDDEWYSCDVALVGRLYQSAAYADICGPLDEYYKGYLEGIVRAQQKIYGGDIIEDMLSEELVEKLNYYYKRASKGTAAATKRQLRCALGTEVTSRDRYTILALLQNRCKVNLYSNERDNRLTNVNFKGYIDYDIQMPSAFRNSKINLNISLRLIRSGIPLRVLDVLACGGFLITNYQQEIAENFEDGRDLVIYEDYLDLVEKVKYYLVHEEERKAIAWNGYNKVKECFNYDDRVRIMFERTR